jgi:hypothetical protein
MEEAVVRCEKASTHQRHEGGQAQHDHPTGRRDATQCQERRTVSLLHGGIIARPGGWGK